MPLSTDFATDFAVAYPPEAPRNRVDPVKRAALSDLLPSGIVAAYSEYGTGKHRGGMFELVDPERYLPTYAAFFGGDSAGRIPFLVNAFGEPVAYKPVGPRESEFSILHTYGPRLEILAYDLGDFLDRVLTTDDGLRQVLNVPLFERLRTRLGRLRPAQSYGFDPGVLATEPAGTKADAGHFEVVDTLEHMSLLLRRAEQ